MLVGILPPLLYSAAFFTGFRELRANVRPIGLLVVGLVQGLTLPAVIRRFHLEDDGLEEKEDTKARIYAAEAAIERLEELLDEDWVRPETAERLRGLYTFRRSRLRGTDQRRRHAPRRTGPRSRGHTPRDLTPS